MIEVKRIMSPKLITVPMETSLSDAHQIMIDARIRHLPVINEWDNIVGIISMRDLAVNPQFREAPVKLVMNSPVVFIDQDTPLRTAVLKILEFKISCLLITDEDKNALGIVTTDDLLWQFAHLLEDEDKDHVPYWSAVKKLTVGEVAKQLANMGI